MLIDTQDQEIEERLYIHCKNQSSHSIHPLKWCEKLFRQGRLAVILCGLRGQPALPYADFRATVIVHEQLLQTAATNKSQM